jgi:Carboxypeptidase regulatory-like domain/TonB-dependent Receptor Plug Domain
MKKLCVVMLCVLAGWAIAAGPAVAQERFGGINGVITDPSGAVLPGATVTVTSKTTGAVRSVTTNDSGMYNLPDLDPGHYGVKVELSGFSRAEIDDINVLLGKTLKVDTALKVGNMSESVQVTAEKPAIDLRSTVVAHNVTAEEIDRMPKGRSFQSIALTAPSVNSGEIEGGFQVNGASGAENAFTVDGVVTNSLVDGRSRQNTVFEYIQEVQVKTTGIAAEYGGALGGVISAVTKSGGNRHTGEAHYYYEGSSLSAGPVKRLVLDPVDDKTVSYVQDDKDPDHKNEIGGSIGGPILKDRLFYFGSYSPRFARRTNSYLFNNGTDPGDMKRKQTYQQAFGKVTYSSSRFTAAGSALYTPTTSEGTLSAYNGSTPNSQVNTKAGLAPNGPRGFKQTQVSTTGNADFILNSSAFLSAKGAFFHDNYKDTGISSTTSYTYGTSAVGVAGVPQNLQFGLNYANTPRALIVDKDLTTRGSFNLDYNQNLHAVGFHTIKGGFGIQHTENDAQQAYPGGYVNIFWDRSYTAPNGVTTGRGTYGYYEVNNRGVQGLAGANITSLYVQDQWVIGNRLSVNLGIRTEHEVVPSFREGIDALDFGFGDKIAPRIGAAYDVRGDGRFKVYGSWGRYYDWTKYELSRGSYGGDVWQVYYRGLDTLDLGSLNLTNMPGKDLWTNPGSFRDRRVPNFDSTDPDIKPMYQDSTSVGTEYQFNSNMVLGVHYVHNNLPRTIEDIGAVDEHGDEVYIIGNPGEGLAEFQFPYTATPFGQPVPKPKRQYDALEFTLTRRFANNFFWNASYVYSRLYGNYAGLAATEEVSTPTTGTSIATAQQQTGSIARPGGNANRYWDIDEVLWDSHGNLDPRGRLATDRPHVVKLSGSYLLPFGTQVGAFFYGGSGTPLTTYVNTSNQTQVFVEGRGDMGRTDVLTRTDLLVSHELKLAAQKRLRLELNVLNVFNQKTSRHLFNNLNRSRASAAINLASTDMRDGYDYNAMIRASSEGAGAYDPRFGQTDLFDTGAQGYFTVKFLF